MGFDIAPRTDQLRNSPPVVTGTERGCTLLRREAHDTCTRLYTNCAVQERHELQELQELQILFMPHDVSFGPTISGYSPSRGNLADTPILCPLLDLPVTTSISYQGGRLGSGSLSLLSPQAMLLSPPTDLAAQLRTTYVHTHKSSPVQYRSGATRTGTYYCTDTYHYNTAHYRNSASTPRTPPTRASLSGAGWQKGRGHVLTSSVSHSTPPSSAPPRNGKEKGKTKKNRTRRRSHSGSPLSFRSTRTHAVDKQARPRSSAPSSQGPPPSSRRAVT